LVHPLTVVDYDFEWALKDHYSVPRSKPGYITREEVIGFYGTLDVQGVELMHAYWDDYSPGDLKKLVGDVGLPITCYVFHADLALPPSERQASIDRAFRLLDRTAELGTTRAMIVPGTAKTDVPLAQQTAWMVEGLFPVAAKAQSMGLLLLAENCDYGPIRPLMGRGSQCRDICAQVDSPAFRLIYDAGCALCGEENTLDTLHVMAPFLVHVHLKNNREMAPGETADRYNESISGKKHYIGATLDGGELDLQPVLAELDRIGYKGELLIEYQGMEDARQVVPHNIEYLKRVMRKSATA
jgi:hydroxypyruvate isomerase